MCETCVLADTQTHTRQAAALSTSWEQKGDGPGQRHSHSAVPKHVPLRRTHTHRHTCKSACTGTEETHTMYRCSCSPQEWRGVFRQIIAMCLEKAGKNALFPVTHRFPLLLLFQALRTNEFGNLCLNWAPVLLCLQCSLGEQLHLIRVNHGQR